MAKPKLNIAFGNGNLLPDIDVQDGIMGITVTADTVALQGIPVKVNSLQDAISKGFTQAAEPAAYRHLQEFYAEIGGNMDLWVLPLPAATTMAQAASSTNVAGAIKLLNAAYAADEPIRILGFTHTPAAGYDGGDDFLDDDVSATVTATKLLGDWALANYMPLRFIVEGRVQNPAAASTFTVSDADVDYTGVLLGGSLNDGSASVGALLGRAAKYSAEQKIGAVENGSLQLNTIYIGAELLKDVTTDYTALGFITYVKQPQKAGFYFGFDYMANVQDYRRLAYGRVVDKAALISIGTYVNFIESKVIVDSNGNIDDLSIESLKNAMRQQVAKEMGNQISDFDVAINPTQDVIDTESIAISCDVTPLGYLGTINIQINLNNPAIAS